MLVGKRNGLEIGWSLQERKKEARGLSQSMAVDLVSCNTGRRVLEIVVLKDGEESGAHLYAHGGQAQAEAQMYGLATRAGRR